MPILTEVEWIHGIGTVKTVGKIMMSRLNKGTLIVGLVFPDIISTDENKEDLEGIGEKEEELWEAEIIIKPIRKFAGHPEVDWPGLNIEQKLSSKWGSGWKKQIYPKT